MENQVFNYNGTNITFQLGNGDVMVNATEMSKPFGKRPSKFLEVDYTKVFIDKLIAVRHRDRSNLISTINGVGTWMHEDLAIEFARWLSPEFAIWCNDRIKELLKHGMTATPQRLEEMITNPDLLIGLAKELKNERAEKERLMQQNTLQSAEMKKQAPKVEYYNEVLTSTSTYNTKHIAKELGMSAITLNRTLHSLGIQYKHRGTWLLYSKHQNKEYTKTETYSFTNSKGETQTSMQTVWTEKGRLFIHELLKKQSVA